jgi:hypothetical protein
MNKLLWVASFLLFSTSANADYTLAASKKLDAKVDVVGAVDSNWCSDKITLKFSNSAGSTLSEDSYAELMPKVQSLLSSQCSKAVSASFINGSKTDSFVFANDSWAKVEKSTATQLDDLLPSTNNSPKNDSEFKDKGKMISLDGVKFHAEKYISAIKDKNIESVKSFADKLEYRAEGKTGNSQTFFADNKELFSTESKVLVASYDEKEIVNLSGMFKVDVTIKVLKKVQNTLVPVDISQELIWFKDSKTDKYKIYRVTQMEDVGKPVDESGNLVIQNWGDLETLAYISSTPIENEIYLGYFISSQNKSLCSKYDKVISSGNINEINTFLSAYESKSKSYQDIVKSKKETTLGFIKTFYLNKESYDESIGGFKISFENMTENTKLKTACSSSNMNAAVNLYISLNINTIPVSPRMLTPILQDQNFIIGIKFKPEVKTYKGKKVFIISSTHTKIIHKKTNTVLVDQDIPSSVSEKAFDNYVQRLEAKQKAYDNLSEECKGMKFLGMGGNCK